MTIVVHKEGLNLGTLNKGLFGYSVHFNTVDVDGQLIKHKTVPIDKDFIMNDWRYATEEEIAQYKLGHNFVELNLSK